MLIDSDEAADLSNITRRFSSASKDNGIELPSCCMNVQLPTAAATKSFTLCPAILVDDGDATLHDLHTYFDSPCRNTDELISLPGMGCARSAFGKC